MDPLPDFSDRRSFPGTRDNEFDVILQKQAQVQNIPGLLFAGLLLLLALVSSYGRWTWALGLLLFFLSDWALLALLPRLGKSFGPPKVPVLLLALARAVFGLLPVAFALPLQVIGTLLVIYSFWIEPHTIRVTRRQLSSKKLRAGAPPLRVLHLGDLHVERITGRERQLNRLIADLKPDLILFSGDILNLSYLDDPVAFDHARQVMAGWRAPGGVFAVSGSPAVDLEELFPRLVAGLPLRWLKDERVTLEVNGQVLDIIGMVCSHKPFQDAPVLERLVEPRTGHFTILLYHTPDLAPHADRTGAVDLQLSGHTHGGQVRLPLFGALYAGLLYGKRFEAGPYQLQNLTLYTSRGIGMEGKGAPRVRFLAPPEMILWELRGEEQP